MALQFTAASSQYLSSGPEYDLPSSWSMTCTVTIDSDGTFTFAGRRGSSGGWAFGRSASGDRIAFTFFGVADYFSSSAVLTSGSRYRIGLRKTGTTLSYYVDGATAGTSTVGTYVNASGGTYPLFLGCRNNVGSPTAYHNGEIADFAIWSADIGAGAVTAIGNGASPLLYPAGLAHYWPLIGRNSPETDIVGGDDVTLVNTPTQAAHPRVYRPSAQILQFPGAAAPPAGAIMNQLQGSNVGADLYNGVLQ